MAARQESGYDKGLDDSNRRLIISTRDRARRFSRTFESPNPQRRTPRDGASDAMRELTQFLGAEYGECTPERKGYRNGSYTRDLATSCGKIEDLQVPRDREGQFHTQAFKRYSRYEKDVADGVTQMFVSGTSTRKVADGTSTLMGVTPSASAVSRLNHTLSEQFETWRNRKLQSHWRIF